MFHAPDVSQARSGAIRFQTNLTFRFLPFSASLVALDTLPSTIDHLGFAQTASVDGDKALY
jgi:hypothetical protein